MKFSKIQIKVLLRITKKSNEMRRKSPYIKKISKKFIKFFSKAKK